MRERVEQGLFLEGGEAGAEEGSFRLLAEKGHSGAGYGKDFLFGHDDCGGRLLDPKEMIAKMKERGISQEAIDHVDENHKNVEQWLTGFGDINHSVQSTVDAIREHPLLPKDLEVLGFIMDPHTGAVRGVSERKE